METTAGIMEQAFIELDGPYAFVHALLQIVPPISDLDLRYIADLISPDDDFLWWLERSGYIRAIGTEEEIFWTSAKNPQPLDEKSRAHVKSSIVRQYLYAVVGMQYQQAWCGKQWETVYCEYRYVIERLLPVFLKLNRAQQEQYLSFVSDIDGMKTFFHTPHSPATEMLFFHWHKDFHNDIFTSDDFQTFSNHFTADNEALGAFDVLPRLVLGADTTISVLIDALIQGKIPFTVTFQEKQDFTPHLVTRETREDMFIECQDKEQKKLYFGILPAKSNYITHCLVAIAIETAKQRGMDAVCNIYNYKRVSAKTSGLYQLSNIKVQYPCKVPSKFDRVNFLKLYINDVLDYLWTNEQEDSAP